MTEETAVDVEAEANKTDTEQDIDSLLSEFEDDKSEKTQEKPPEDPRWDMVESIAARQEQQDLNDTTSQIKELDERLKDLPDRIVKNLLRAEAADDPRIEKAYGQRFQNPDKWATVQKSLAKTLGEQLVRPDQKLTSDTEAAKAAVKGSSTSQPADTLDIDVGSLGSMSDHEFRELEKKAMRG